MNMRISFGREFRRENVIANVKAGLLGVLEPLALVLCSIQLGPPCSTGGFIHWIESTRNHAFMRVSIHRKHLNQGGP